MAQNIFNQGMSDRTRYLLAAILICSALLLGVVAPVKATDVYFKADWNEGTDIGFKVDYNYTLNEVETTGLSTWDGIYFPGPSNRVEIPDGATVSCHFPDVEIPSSSGNFYVCQSAWIEVNGDIENDIFGEHAGELPESGYTIPDNVYQVVVHAIYVKQTQPTNSPPILVVDNDQITVNEGKDATNTGTWSDPETGDEVTLSASVGEITPSSVTGETGMWTWSYSPTDGPAESQTVTITADDGTEEVSKTFSMEVANVEPLISDFSVPLVPMKVGDSVNAGASFTDPGKTDKHTAVWMWDETTTTAGTVAESGGSGTVSGSHTYTTPGIYMVSVTVTDGEGGAATKGATTPIVVYDPNGGFATGGGWFNSPEGAYPAKDVSGKMHFAFVSKYKKGETEPRSGVKFDLKEASLEFESTTNEFLVVSGSKATYQGTGVLNGDGGYKFLLSVVDGSPDMIRVKIWKTDSISGTITTVYDSQMDAEDYAAPAMPVGGGNINVHG